MSDTAGADVLIVDDKPDNLHLLGDMLGARQYQLRFFSEPVVALESALEKPPELFVLDVSMPEMDGFELCARLKADARTADVPIVFLSALRDTQTIVEGFRRGAVDYITKPFQVEEVLTRIATHLGFRQAKIALAERNAELEKTLAELKAAQSQLVQSSKMASLGVLTAGIAHEINNPLNFVVANANLLNKVVGRVKRGVEPDGGYVFEDDDLECLDHIAEGQLDGANRILEIVEGLRLFSRSGEDGRSSYPVRRNVEATLKLFRHLIRRGIDVRVDVPEDLETLANPGQINQVLANLISNAIAAVEEDSVPHPCIEISGTKQVNENGDTVRIDILDNGPGIPRELQDRVFEPFFTTRDPGKGVGLGLSISSSLVESNHGRLRLHSEPGSTRFTIELPYEGV